jgi:hypothetical protein
MFALCDISVGTGLHILYFCRLHSVCCYTAFVMVCHLLLCLSCAHCMPSFPYCVTLCVVFLNCCGIDNDSVMSCLREIIF